MKKKTQKPFSEMTTAELREATKEFDKPSADDYGFRPLTPAQRARWNRVKRHPGRPKIGKGSTAVLISIERELLKQADALASKEKLSRSQLFARGVRTLLKAG